MPTYTHTSGAVAEHLSAEIAIPFPSSISAGNLLICYCAVRQFNGGTVGTTPATSDGFTLLATSSPGTSDASWVYGKIATGSESGTVPFDTGVVDGQAGQMARFPPPAGYTWPAIAGILAGSTEASSGATTALIYAARTVGRIGNLVIQFAKKPSSGTITAIASTSGFTKCVEGYGSGGFVMSYAGQYQSVTGNVAANSVAITTEATSSAVGGLTVELICNGPLHVYTSRSRRHRADLLRI